MPKPKREPKTVPQSTSPTTRINKYLAEKGYSTRRGADALIEAHQVRINGKVAVLGDKVGPRDVVEVLAQERKKAYVYVAYNKPKGVITHSPAEGEKDIARMLKGVSVAEDLFPIGRLDKASSGLMLLTNDGRVTDRLLNPKYAHEREYIVTVDKKVNNFFLHAMEKGVRIERYTTKPARLTKVDDYSFSIVLTEGKKHQIRRMCAALGYVVVELSRVRIMNIELGTLKANGWKKLDDKIRVDFLKSIGL